MNQSPIDGSHQLLKARLMASFKRVERTATRHSKQTKTFQAALEEEHDKGEESRLFKLSQLMETPDVDPQKDEEEEAA